MAYDRSNTSRIPRKTLTARHRTKTKLSTSAFSNILSGVTKTEYDLLLCTVQPLRGSQRDVLPDSIRQLESYYIYTSTQPTVAIEGTETLSDQIQLFSYSTQTDAWFTVYECYPYQVGLIPHYKLIVYKEIKDND